MQIPPPPPPARVLGLYTQPGASAYYRLIVPLRAIGGTWAQLGSVSPAQYDAAETIVWCRPDAATPEHMLQLIRSLQAAGKQVIVDYDDDVLQIPATNRSRRGETSGILAALRSADAVTTTNSVLAGRLSSITRVVRVLPNYVWPDDWPAPAGPPPRSIGLAGSHTHHEDWKHVAPALRRIRAAYPDVPIRTIGYTPVYLQGLATPTPWVPLECYPAQLRVIGIGLAPLPYSAFNQCKSPIKAYEYALAGAAVIGSPCQYGDILRGRGAVAHGWQEWERAIRRYLDAPSVQASDAAALRAHVLATRDARRYTALIEAAYE